MATLDHIILKVNDLEDSIAFYTDVMGFENAGEDGPFTVIRVNESFQIQLAPWNTKGQEGRHRLCISTIRTITC